METEIDDLLPWKNLYALYKNTNYSASEDHRKFKAWVGVHPNIAEYIFSKYQDRDYLPNRTRLLIVLYFLKDMPTEDEGAAQFQINSRTTYRKYLWDSLHYLDYQMDEIKLEDRYKPFFPTCGIFEGTEFIFEQKVLLIICMHSSILKFVF